MSSAPLQDAGKQPRRKIGACTTDAHSPHCDLHKLPTTSPLHTGCSQAAGSTLAPHYICICTYSVTRRFPHQPKAHYAPTGTRSEADSYAAQVLIEPKVLQAPETTRKSLRRGGCEELWSMSSGVCRNIADSRPGRMSGGWRQGWKARNCSN